MTRFVVIVVALVASVGLNVHQQCRGRPACPRAGTPAPAPAPATAGTPPPASAGAPARDAPIAQLAGCPAQLGRMTDEVAALQRKVEERLTMDEIYERSGPSAESEAIVRKQLEPMFAEAPPGYGYTLDCRGEVCNIDVTVPEDGDWKWDQKLQSPAMLGMSAGFMMRAGTPGQDPVTKEPFTVFHNQIRLRDVDVADGITVLRDLDQRFAASDAYARCAGRTPGYLLLQLSLDGDHRRITYSAGGTLPATPFGSCLLASLDLAIAAAAIPAQVRGGTYYTTHRFE